MRSGVLNDRYRLERELHTDGDVVEYVATDLQRGQEALVKVVRPERAADEAFVAAYRQNLARVGVVHAPGLATAYDVHLEGPTPYLVEPRIDGDNLASRLVAGQSYTWTETARVGEQLARALAAVHQAGLVHGGIRPETVVIDATGTPYLTDLGRPLSPLVDLEAARYLSPEQLDGRMPDSRSDVYSLAAVLYHMFGGMPPFDGPDAATVTALKRAQHPTPLAQLRPDMPPELAAAIDQALSRTPSDRPANGLELLQALTRRAAPAVIVRDRRPVWPYLLAALLGLTALAALAYALLTTRVPVVAGLTETQARAALDDRDLDPVVVGYAASPTAAPGTVIAQEPAAGERVLRGDDVRLTVAAMSDVAVPSVVGLTQAAAYDRVAAAGLRVGAVSAVQTTASARGVVTSQQPGPGARVPAGSAVAMTVNYPNMDMEIPPPIVIERETTVIDPTLPDVVPVPVPVSPPATTVVPQPVPVPVPVPSGPSRADVQREVDRAVAERERQLRDQAAREAAAARAAEERRRAEERRNAEPAPPAGDGAGEARPGSPAAGGNGSTGASGTGGTLAPGDASTTGPTDTSPDR